MAEQEAMLKNHRPSISRNLVKRLLGVSIGGFLEWFDYSIYAVFAVIISKQIFGSIGAIFLVFLSYALGFVMRPVGSFFFGHIGDKFGRKRALTLTFWIMGGATVLTGLVPGYANIGIGAPILITLARVTQGFGTGGEWGSASAYLIEQAGSTRRGLYSSIQEFISLLGFVVSTAVGLALVHLPTSFLSSIGWRIPFLVGGLVIIPLAYLSRKGIPETNLFEETKAKSEIKSSPIIATLRNDYKPFLIIIFGAAALTTAFYGAITYMTTYIVTVVGLSLSIALIATLTSLVLVTFLTPVFGYLSDKFKTRKKLFLLSTLLLIPVTPIYFLTVGTKQIVPIMFMAAIFGIAASVGTGTLISFISESFPTSERVTGNASYNISAAYFGGFAPVISIALIGFLHSELAPAYYVMAVAIMSAVVICFAKDTGKMEKLPETNDS
ncbi:MAG TPA: MFS transporter [Candidatus Limnocylindrales bacterium]|nr:MFS transporter [Candidatus Limnocylindrales bacterium]